MYRCPRTFKEKSEPHKARDSEAPGFTTVPWVAIKMICFKESEVLSNNNN